MLPIHDALLRRTRTLRSFSVNVRLFLSIWMVTAIAVFASLPAVGAQHSVPYGGAAVAVSATATTRVEAENYDTGGEGIAYHDVDNGGQTDYRSDNVGIFVDSWNASGGYAVGYTAGGEWDGYTLNVAQAGLYAIAARVASPSSSGTFHLEFGPVGQIGGAGVVSSSEFTNPYRIGGTYKDVTVPAVSLPAGLVWMRVVIDSAYPCNIDSFRIEPSTASPSVVDLPFNPNPVANGGFTYGYAKLSSPAPAGGTVVTLSSDNAAASVPASVTVESGSTQAYVPVTIAPVNTITVAHITASSGDSPISAALTLAPVPSLSEAAIYTPIAGGESDVLSLGLNAPAPSSGLAISMTSDNAAVSVPMSATFPGGQLYDGIPIATSVVAAPTTAHIQVTVGGVSQSVSLTVIPFGLVSLDLDITSAHGGDSDTGTVSLSDYAPTGGVTISLSSNNPAAAVPSSVTIPAGSPEANFPITTSAVSAPVTANISASLLDSTVSAPLLVNPLSAPTNLTASAVATGPSTVLVNLNWTAGVGATVYALERSPDDAAWTQIAAPTGNSYQDATTSAGTYYYYRVKAASDGGSAYSNEAYVSTALPYLVATDLTWLPAHPVVGDQVRFYAVIQNQGTGTAFANTWTVEFEGDPGETGFAIEPNDLAPGDTLLVTEANNQWWTATAGTHSIAVVIDDSYVSLTKNVTVACAAPTGLTATAVSESEIDLSWQPSAGATTYNLYRSTSNGGETLYKSGLTSASYADTGLTAGQTYYYQVTAVASDTESDRSAEAAAGDGITPGSGADLGFEAPVVGTNAFQYAPTGSPWTFNSGSGISGNGSALTSANPNAPEGVQVGFVQGTGAISQPLISSVAGAWTVTFAAAQQGNYGAGGQSVQVTLDGAVVGTITPTSNSYADYSVGPVNLPAGTHTLQFAGANLIGGGNAALLDNVRIRVDAAPSQVDGMSYFTTINNTNWTYAGYGGMRSFGTGMLTVSGVTGAVTRAYLYWHGPTNSDDPAANAIVTFAGHKIIGTNIGFAADNNWLFENSQAYRADVTGLVAGDGSYSLADFRNFDADTSDVIADINGVSLIVFYNGDPSHYRNVTIFNGNDSNESYPPINDETWNDTFSNINYLGGDAALYLGVSDGQVANGAQYADGEVDINGAMLVPDGNDFNGDSVPNGTSGVPDDPYYHGGLWDVKGYALSPFLHPGSNSLALTAVLDADCLSLVYAIVDQPAAGAMQGPPRPENLTAVPGDSQVTLSWSPYSGATYALSRALSAAGPFQVVAADLPDAAYIDSGLTNGTTYYYTVTASDSFGTSAPSNIADATPTAGPAGDFEIAASPDSLALSAGASGQSAVQVTPTDGFTGPIQLTLTDPANAILGPSSDPTKISAALDPTAVNLNGTDAATSNLTLAIGAQVAPGAYTLQLTGSDASGMKIHSVPISVTVTPSNSGVHLADLTLSPTAVTGGDSVSGTTTVTVTLSNPASADVIVTLRSNSPMAPVPNNIVIPQGQTAYSFQVETSTVSEATQATISGYCGGWAQAAILTILPANQSFDIQNLTATPGNGCALLSWTDLPDGSIQGYNIYRISAGVATLLTESPQPAPIFADTGLTNGVAYQYEVSCVTTQGIEQSLSQPISVVPSNSIAVLSWSNPPAMATGIINLYSTLSTDDMPSATTLLVDGRAVGGGGENTDPVNGDVIQSLLDTTSISNGNHIAQLVGEVDGVSACATQPITINVVNALSNFSYDDIIQPSFGELARINAVAPADTTQWTLSIIRSSDGAVVKSWQDSTSLIHLAWDGTDASDAPVDDENYTISISYIRSSDNINQPQTADAIADGHQDIAVANHDPIGLALIDTETSGSLDQPNLGYDFKLKFGIQDAFKKLEASNPGFHGIVLSSGGHESIHEVNLIRKWMGTSVLDFYLFGHGFQPKGAVGEPSRIPRGSQWGHTFFYSDYLLSPPKTASNIIVPSVTAGRPYVFAQMDSCTSAGGTFTTDIGNVDLAWSKAFNVGDDPDINSCFMGWNGLMSGNYKYLDAPPYETKDSMHLTFELAFWDALANGESVNDAWHTGYAATGGNVDYVPAGVAGNGRIIPVSVADPGRTVFDVGLYGFGPEYTYLPYGL